MESFLERRPLGEESLQMWDLNKRLEAYLARVKFLEEENEVLKCEIRGLKGSPPEGSWRGKYEEQLAALRATLDEAFREKHVAEVAKANLQEEVQQVKSRCQKERAAREEAKKLLALSKKGLEEEKRSHIWLRERAAQLQKEVEVLAEAHGEERARLDQELAGFSWGLEGFRGTLGTFQPVEVEDYSERLSHIWRGAVETYKTEVSQLEASFGEAKESLWKAAESNRQNQLQLQHLERDWAGLKARKETLQERLAQQWQHQRGEAQKLQLAMEGLEEEKRALTVQIGQVLEDQRQLMHLKMSLSLEVATYRTLLEAESTRLQMPAEPTLALSLQDSKREASVSHLPGVSLERGRSGSRDIRPSPAAFWTGGVALPPRKNQNGSFTVSVASGLPKRNQSPGLGEPQKAKAFEGMDVPDFIDSAAFKLGSLPQNEGVAAPDTGTVSQSFAHEVPPLFTSLRPPFSKVSAEPSSSAGQSGGEISAQVKTEESGKKVELHEEMEEEEEEPSGEEPLWTAAAHNGPGPSRLVTETSLQEVPGGPVRFEAGWLNVAGTPNGIPVDESEEEENGAAISPSTAALGDPVPEPRHSADLLEDINGSVDSAEGHGAPDAAVWMSHGADPSPLQDAELVEEERSPSARQSKGDFAFDIPVTGEAGCCNRMSPMEQTEGGNEQPPHFQSLVQRDELAEGAKDTESGSQLDVDAAAFLSSSEPGLSYPEDHTGALGADLEEADGGAEDLEVVSTEALHLSEDEEERRALSSPSKESEEGDFQAEMLESEFLQAEELVVETLSPINHLFYSAEGHQEPYFLGIEQEIPEEQTRFSKSDSVWPEQEGEEQDSDLRVISIADEAILRDEHTTNILSAEPRVTEEAGAEEEHIWEPQQHIMGHKGLLEEEDALGKEDRMETNEIASLQDATSEQETVLQMENVESAPRKGIAKGEQGEEMVEPCQGDLQVERWMEDGEITTKGEETGEACQEAHLALQWVEKEEITTKGGDILEASQEDHPIEQQMEEEEIITKDIAEVCQGDLPTEQQVEEEETTTKGQEMMEACQGAHLAEQWVEKEEITSKEEETVEPCQGDLPTEQWVEEEEITTKSEETIEVCQGSVPTKQQMEEEETTTKGEEMVEACQEDHPAEQQVEEEEITTKREETVEVCQGDLPTEQCVEEEEITTKREETVELCPGDLPTEQCVEEEEITTKREETVEVCQGDLPTEQWVEEEEITTKREEIVELCPGDLPTEQCVEEEEITTKREETVELCPGDLPTEQCVEEEEITAKREETVELCPGDLPTEQCVEEEEITTKREETVELCPGELPMEQCVEEEEITIKREETVVVCPGDLPTEQCVEEEEITTKREETVELCPGDLPTEQCVEEEEITTKREETVELCPGELPMEQCVEEEEITTKREETVDVCQGNLPTEQCVEEEEIATKREETVELCPGDLPTEQCVEEEEITTKREETVELCPGDLPMEQCVEEEEITTKREETVELCPGDLPTEKCVEEEEITTKREETVELRPGDLPTEQCVEEEEITTKRKETVELCPGDHPTEHQLEEEEITAKGEQGEEMVEACHGDLQVEQWEEENPKASPESDVLDREVLVTGSESMEAEEMGGKTSPVEMEETGGYVITGDLQQKEDPQVKVVQADPPQEEQRVTPEREETFQKQHPPPHEASPGGSEVPSEVRSNTATGFEAESHSGPWDGDLSSESDHQLQSDYSGSLESFEVSPNATSETEGIEKELEGSKQIRLEETLPDNTPLHLYEEHLLVVAGKVQLHPENEEAAETALFTTDSTCAADATEQPVEEACPFRAQTKKNNAARVLEGAGEEGESAPKQHSPDSEELPVSEVFEEEAETVGLTGNGEEEDNLHSWEPEKPGAEAHFPSGDAEFDEQHEKTLQGGSGSRKEPAGGEMAREETCSTDFVWEAEGNTIFQADQPGPFYAQECVWGGSGGNPLEFSDPHNIVSEGSHRVSPLTSVADLGEIVLEGEQFPDGQKEAAEFEGLVYSEDERGLEVHGSQPISDLENRGGGDAAQPTDLTEMNASIMDLTDPSPKAEASLPIDSLKDSDILEIVEQALEFNQEVIKAAEQTSEAQGDIRHSPEGESHGSCLALPDAGRSQVLTAAPEALSPGAQDPTGPGHLWVEKNSYVLQHDSSLPQFTTEILNGLGDLHPGHGESGVGSPREGLTQEVATSQLSQGEFLDDLSLLETMNQNPPQTPADEEAPRTGGISPEIQKAVPLEHRGPAGPNVDKSFFANIMQSAHVKGKDAEMETVSIPPRFGEEILHLESTQHLKFQPGDEEELWSPEDN
ncbi:nestin isoform X2 [Sphaerodactylus townsendi]|uniref:nestin isoform X2 n=1 Tax=Sphaerodactylus townsendi TaxID=933632 RepID=UPI0020271DCC|nr:nestin isoform X2 [Sphaerodactylus townsendi]